MKRIFRKSGSRSIRKEAARRVSNRINLSHRLDILLRRENNIIEDTGLSLDEFLLNLAKK